MEENQKIKIKNKRDGRGLVCPVSLAMRRKRRRKCVADFCGPLRTHCLLLLLILNAHIQTVLRVSRIAFSFFSVFLFVMMMMMMMMNILYNPHALWARSSPAPPHTQTTVENVKVGDVLEIIDENLFDFEI